MQKKCNFLHSKQDTQRYQINILNPHPRNTRPITTQYPPDIHAIPTNHAGCKPLRRAPLARPDRLAERSATHSDSRPAWAVCRPAALSGSFGALGGSGCYSAAVSQPPYVCKQQQPMKNNNNTHTTTTCAGVLAPVACSGRCAPFSNATLCETLGALRVLYCAPRAFCLSSALMMYIML